MEEEKLSNGNSDVNSGNGLKNTSRIFLATGLVSTISAFLFCGIALIFNDAPSSGNLNNKVPLLFVISLSMLLFYKISSSLHKKERYGLSLFFSSIVILPVAYVIIFMLKMSIATIILMIPFVFFVFLMYKMRRA